MMVQVCIVSCAGQFHSITNTIEEEAPWRCLSKEWYEKGENFSADWVSSANTLYHWQSYKNDSKSFRFGDKLLTTGKFLYCDRGSYDTDSIFGTSLDLRRGGHGDDSSQFPFSAGVCYPAEKVAFNPCCQYIRDCGDDFGHSLDHSLLLPCLFVYILSGIRLFTCSNLANPYINWN